MLSGFFKKREVRPLLSEEDQKKLRDIENKSYMQTAEKLMEERGRQRAIRELSPKEEKKDKWQLP